MNKVPDREETLRFFEDNLNSLSEFCRRYITESLAEAWDNKRGCWHPEYDEWEGYSDDIDINFFTDAGTRPTMYATAYLVVNDRIVYERFYPIVSTTEMVAV